jgi:hypothetical protein
MRENAQGLSRLKRILASIDELSRPADHGPGSQALEVSSVLHECEWELRGLLSTSAASFGPEEWAHLRAIRTALARLEERTKAANDVTSALLQARMIENDGYTSHGSAADGCNGVLPIQEP